MKKVMLMTGFALLTGVVVFRFSDRSFSTNIVADPKAVQPSTRGEQSPPFPPDLDRAVVRAGNKSSIALKENGYNLGWEDALKYADSLKGEERNSFLMNYLDEFSQEEDFDRVGFFTNLMQIKGPGGDFLAMLTNVYSRPIRITAEQFLDEISNYELTNFEYEVLMTSGGGEVFRDFDLEGIKIVLKNEPNAVVADLLVPMFASRLSKNFDNLSPDQIIQNLNDVGMKSKHKQSVIYNLVRTSPDSWWNHFKDFATKTTETSGPSSDYFKNNANLWASSFLNHKSPADLLELTRNGRAGSQEIVKVASARWAAQDTSELAQWIEQQPAGPIKDLGIASLARYLDKHNFSEEARTWINEISDHEIQSALRSKLKKD